jgi:hypothetical protein
MSANADRRQWYLGAFGRGEAKTPATIRGPNIGRASFTLPEVHAGGDPAAVPVTNLEGRPNLERGSRSSLPAARCACAPSTTVLSTTAPVQMGIGTVIALTPAGGSP